MKSFLFVG